MLFFDKLIDFLASLFSQLIADSMTRVVSKYVSKYVSMRHLARFICNSGSNIRNLIKFCMNITIGYAGILAFHIFHVRGQTNSIFENTSYI